MSPAFAVGFSRLSVAHRNIVGLPGSSQSPSASEAGSEAGSTNSTLSTRAAKAAALAEVSHGSQLRSYSPLIIPTAAVS